jgi:hypothetical protein
MPAFYPFLGAASQNFFEVCNVAGADIPLLKEAKVGQRDSTQVCAGDPAERSVAWKKVGRKA